MESTDAHRTVELDPGAGDVVSFGPFRLKVGERLLLKGGAPISLGGRALDILIALVERAGDVVSRRELMDRVWPDVVVEEANLRVHLAGLRKALGDGQEGARYITNVPGRGYCFVAPVTRGSAVERPPSGAAGQALRIPARLGRMVGRDETVASLCQLIRTRRFVSIVGPGGMGKTTVAVAVAHELAGEFGNEVCFVDLSAIADPAYLTTAVASALGCYGQGQDPMPGLLAFLAHRSVLLVLDNCEHVINAAAALTERLFSQAPRVHLLATTREALRVEGENVHLLLPLDSPVEDSLRAADAMASPAVQLFMERAAASGHRLELTDADAPVVARICRRLDGIALAIELAAGRVGTYGISGTADLLDNRFRLLWQGRRSSLPRHQTLQAMLDWSYNLLGVQEQRVLRRLSVFVGPFTLDDAIAVAGEEGANRFDIAESLAGLIDKSLIWTSGIGGAVYHRLLDTTRTYAAVKLAESGEEDWVAKQHALHYADLLRTDAIRTTAFGGGDVAAYAPRLGNIRAALEWCFSKGDAALGVDLAASSAPLFLGFSLLGECERWCERGLEKLSDAERGTQRELALQEALAISSMFTRGNGDSVRRAIERGLSLAKALGDREYQLHLLAGINIFLTRIGDFRAALAYAEHSVALASEGGDHAGRVMAEWMLGVSHHLVGNQEAAQYHCEQGLELEAAAGGTDVNFFGYDHQVRALVALARALWLRGYPKRAVSVAQQAISAATSGDQPVTVCIAYIYSTPVFLWVNDLDRAAECIDRLIAHAEKYSLAPYRAVGLALRGELLILRGDAAQGVALLRSALTVLQADRHNILTTVFSRALAEGLSHLGQLEEARMVIEGAVALAQERGAAFDLADLLRTNAEILLMEPQPNLVVAEEMLRQSLEVARQQSAIAWELKAASVLAELLAKRGDANGARDLLAAIQQRLPTVPETVSLQITHVLPGSSRPAEGPSARR
jgi:predicted ATPase/DNA-binding winged helix-turn-helix (wHTH) protein